MLSKHQQGLFWDYTIPAKKHIAIPPDPFWLENDYLPNIDKARSHTFETFENDELWTSTDEPLVFDIEIYPNYFLICFKSVVSGKSIYFEKDFDIPTLQYIFDNYTVIGFNSIKYDIILATMAIGGCTVKQIYEASNALIVDRAKGYEVLRKYNLKKLSTNHIDLIEVCPLSGSLKIYGARLHTKQLQDLPFPPHKNLTEDQILVLRWYCFNDLEMTKEIYHFLEDAIRLREEMGYIYGMDLRSKSDAQIAETVFANEIYKLTGVYPKKKEDYIDSLTYDPPNYLDFKTPVLQEAFETVKNARFSIGADGSPIAPDTIKKLLVTIGETTYQLGMGGLHSTESNKCWIAEKGFKLVDRDVVSYYPFIILNNELYPEALGEEFLSVYRNVVNKRLKAKKEGDKLTANSLKITINGSFGKFGNFYSILYSPKLLLQVTITGQLSLLYLIEKIEQAGIRCVSANTDGVVIKCPLDRSDDLEEIVAEWEQETSFETEETNYLGLFSRSVNDYMALKTDMKVKGKGKLGWGINQLFKNPDNNILITAIENLLSKGIPIEETIYNCKDIAQFVTVITAKGGAVKDKEYLGKVVRYYYSTETYSPIIKTNGHKVPNSEGARPVMELGEFPADLDHQQYIKIGKKMLAEMGLEY